MLRIFFRIPNFLEYTLILHKNYMEMRVPLCQLEHCEANRHKELTNTFRQCWKMLKSYNF